MTTATDELWTEAKGQLEAYLATGLAGFRQQAWDRLASLGVRLDGIERTAAGAEFLRRHFGW